MDSKAVLQKAKKDGVKFVELQFTDIFGAIKSVTITAERLDEAIGRGIWFDGSSIEGFTRICESDMYLMPDIDTYAVLPWKSNGNNTARFICDVYTPDGKPYAGAPRAVLKAMLEKAKKLGYIYNVGPELEFFLFKKDECGCMVPHDSAGYFDYAPSDMASGVREIITKNLEQFGFDVEMLHHEVAPGQHEIDFKYGEALIQADRVMTFKYVAKTIAQEHGLHASFMPKPIFGENGSGMHVHQSLYDVKKKTNVFYDAKGEFKVSDIARSFIAGQLEHARAFCAVTAPTVNSYKRLVPGYEAPVYACYGQKNRSAMIRIPRYSPGREQSTRAELRCPDPSSNPYLAFAVMLAAGMDGMERKLTPPKAVEENVYEFDKAMLGKKGIATLPGSLEEAICELSKDKVMMDALGEDLGPKFVKAKKQEYDSFKLAVTDWEKDRYFGVL